MSSPQNPEMRHERLEGIPPPASHPDDELDLGELLRVLRRRKGIILGTIVTITALALLIIFQLTPRYTASSVVMIDPREVQVVDVEAVLSGLSSDRETIESEIQVIRSRGLAKKVVAKLKLDKDPEFNDLLRPPTVAGRLLDFRQYFSKQEKLSEEETAERARTRIIDAFVEKLEVKQEGRARVIFVSFESENRHTAALVANTLADLYIVAQLEAKFEATKRANTWLNERLSELRAEVGASERAVEEFRAKSGLVRGKDVSLAFQEISEVSSQLIQARLARAGAEARLRQIEVRLSSVDGVDSVSEVLESPLIQRLRQQEADVERSEAELATVFGARHPKMINVRAEVRDLRAKIEREVGKIVGAVRNEVAVARAREAALEKSLEKLKSELTGLNKSEVQLRAHEREAQANRTLFETFLARFKETSSQQGFQQADATILSRADVPDKASFPRKGLLLAVSMVGAGVLGLLLAFAREQLDHGFRSMEQLEQLMGVSALGIIPSLKRLGAAGKAPEAYLLERPTSAYSEAIRSLHTGLLLSDVDQPPKVILIASALPKEGKTVTAVSLARILGSIGHKVIIVDCDLRRATAHEAFGVSSRPGLVECLTGEKPVDEAIQKDEKSGAHLLAAGAPAPNPPDLLGSEQMKNLLVALAESYELVILDSAPVLAVSDARVLSRLADKTVFLVRWTDTRRETAVAALRQLIDAGSDVAGVVLTMVDVKKHARYGYADSGYYYGRVKKYYTG